MQILAHLVTEVYTSLGLPTKELIEPEDLVGKVRGSIAFYDLDLLQSNQNQVIARKPFTPSTREHSLPDVSGTPLWMEYQIGVAPYDSWPFLPSVNLASIEDERLDGYDRWACFTENGILKIRFSYLPSGSQQHRLWYDPDPSLEITLADPLRTPTSFYPMFAARAILDCGPIIALNAAKLETPPSDLMVAAWASVQQRAAQVIKDYEPLWKQHRLGSRGGQRGRNRRPVLSY